MSPIIAVRRALSAETLKLKRTLALWMVLIAPLTVVALNFLMLWQRGASYLLEANSPWESLARNIMTFWALLMLPLYVTLETSLLGSVEHNNQQWKHLYALSLPRWSIYAAKWLISIALVAASTLVLWIGTIACGLLLNVIEPALKLSGSIPLWTLLQPMMLIGLIAMLIVAIHLFVGVRWPNFTVSIGFGMVATTANIMIMQSEKWSKVYPWSLPLYALEDTSAYLSTALTLGLVGGLIIGWLGLWRIARREVL
ncbi:MAG: ABC transporter permease [Anaerolineae bacterium]